MDRRVEEQFDSFLEQLCLPGDMAELPPDAPYSKSEIVEAGKHIMSGPTEVDEATVRAFRIVNAWRDSHIRPMVLVRAQLSGYARRDGRQGAVTVARLKRLQSIKRKLRRQLTLYQIQDIGGCRAIMDSMAEVEAVMNLYHQDCPHGIKHTDYILNPRSSGYRGHHLVLKFQGIGSDLQYKRHTIEVQIRTKLQHAWATAVEAVGLVRNENLKGGEGDSDWLRFFALMASEFADEEGGGLVPGMPSSKQERVSELRDLERKLRAIVSLEGYSKAVRGTDDFRGSSYRYFVVEFDHHNNGVSIKPFVDYAQGSDAYFGLERGKKATSITSVLVEADKVGDLKAGYPNYFMDVAFFVERLRVSLNHVTAHRKKFDVGPILAFQNRKRR